MTSLNPQLFGAPPRKELDKLLQVTTEQFTTHTLSPQEALTRINSAAFMQTLRSLTLPDPRPTPLLTKRNMPEQPLSYTQLKQWQQATILKIISTPVPNGQNDLYTRQQYLYLLSQLTFKD